MTKLKPCPFCGSKAELYKADHPNGITVDNFVQCTNCLAQTRYVTDLKLQKNRAEELWNRRVNNEPAD